MNFKNFYPRKFHAKNKFARATTTPTGARMRCDFSISALSTFHLQLLYQKIMAFLRYFQALDKSITISYPILMVLCLESIRDRLLEFDLRLSTFIAFRGTLQGRGCALCRTRPHAYVYTCICGWSVCVRRSRGDP